MSWQTVTIICLLVINGCIAALLFRTHQTSVSALERAHERSNTYTEGLLDRLMAMDFSEYKGARLTEKLLKAQSVEPVEMVPEELRATLGPDRGGFGSRLGLRALSAEEVEQELMDGNL